MTEKEFIEAVMNDTESGSERIDELKSELEKETQKPFKQQSYGKISSISAALARLESGESSTCLNRIEEGVNKKIENHESRGGEKRLRCAVVILSILVFILSINTVTVSAWNMNVFSLVVELTQGGVKIDFSNQETNQKEEIVLPTSEDDPYGIIAVCEDMGIYIETPHYLPEGYILTDMFTEENDIVDVAAFTFSKGNRYVSINFSKFHNEDSLSVGIPSDEHNLTEITVNGHTGIKSMEDNQMVITFASGTVVFNMFTQEVDYDECEKIIESLK